MSKAAYRARRSADDAFREAERQRVREWRRKHPDKARAQKTKARAANYHRPFVAIDTEGQNYPGARHRLRWRALSAARHLSVGRGGGRWPAAFWLMAAETRGLDKRPLDAVEILDWLLSLPEQFGPAVFVMFSFGYDITQILKHLPYEKAWEIEKRETYPDRNGKTRRIAHSPVLWKGYAISYVKGKSFDVWRLADPEKPYRGKKLHTSAHIRIYDVFGFFQSSFSAVVKSMVDSGRATKEEADFIAAMKDRRDQFANEEIEQIKAYTTLELRLLARMMGDLRTGFEEIGLHLRHWHGAGAAASALIESQKLKMHYGRDIAASNISPQQTAAHHAYYGGRIELLKQGYVENRALARLRHRLRLSGGNGRVSQPRRWRVGQRSRRRISNRLAQRIARRGRSRVTAFRCSRSDFSSQHTRDTIADARKAVFIPFYPLPYRDKRGGILFPASGYGWYMRDDVLAAIAWLERFVPDFPRPRSKHQRMTAFEIEEAWIFEPRHEGRPIERPFEFIRDLFLKRRQIKDESGSTGQIRYSREDDQTLPEFDIRQARPIGRR